MSEQNHEGDRWARLRFAIVGPLLAAPPAHGELREALAQLARKPWRHPTSGVPVRFARSTIERWYYLAQQAKADPVSALRPKRRQDAGHTRRLSPALTLALRAQYQAHPSWSYRLHHDNLVARLLDDPTLGARPAYATVRRYLKNQGLFKQRRCRNRHTAGAEAAAERLERLEVRSFEADYVHGLWHLDFHHGSRPVLSAAGTWVTPLLFGVLDDRSRLCCHLQWYLDETAESLVHGLSQAFQKRGLPRALMTDLGSAMVAAEVKAGLHTLGIVHTPTLPYSPYQNAKQEVFWAQVEGRLMAMLEGVEPLDLKCLNEATQAWVELEYQRAHHSELSCSPLQRYLEGPAVGRESPSSDALRRAFRAEVSRRQRRSDGTFSLEGRRYEVPSRYRHLERLHLRYARWDLATVDLVDPHRHTILCALYPLDKSANADGQRRRLEPMTEPPSAPQAPPPASGMAPLLRQLMAQYAATGLPPAYLPKVTDSPDTDSEPAK